MWDPAGKLFRQVEVVALTREVNVGTTPADFQLALPAGTWLAEEGDKMSEHSIIRENGTKRTVLPSEAGAPYDELLRTNTGDLGPKPNWRWSWWTALGLLIMAGSLLLLFRRRLFSPFGGTTPPSSPSP
jgi:hypothetical protein